MDTISKVQRLKGAPIEQDEPDVMLVSDSFDDEKSPCVRRNVVTFGKKAIILLLLTLGGVAGSSATPAETLEDRNSSIARVQKERAAFLAEKEQMRARLLSDKQPPAVPKDMIAQIFTFTVPSLFDERVIAPSVLPEAATFNQPLNDPPEIHSSNGILNTTLEVRYATNSLWSIQQNKSLLLHLRSYNGQPVGSTLRLNPGDILNVHLINNLPPEIPMTGMADMLKTFNTTNLHTHGLHVSPSGTEDNVLVEVPPGKDRDYTIHIPSNHPCGTFWYHSHVHGSTAVQVSSGMEGALIIAGGIDTVPELRSAKEHTLMFQQIPYLFDGSSQTYGIEDFWKSFGPNVWSTGIETNGWRTTINGQVLPMIAIEPGEVQRWRLIHGGSQETINFQLEGHLLYKVADDGITIGKKIPCRSIELEPGYRSDVLVKADSSDAGKVFFLIDSETDATDSLLAGGEGPKVLGALVVGQTPTAMNLPSDGDLLKFVPLKAITAPELTGKQTATFDVDTTMKPARMMIDGKTFDSNAETRKLKLGAVEEWTLTSKFANHPFHIHTNPFQVVSMINPDGVETVVEPFWKDTLLIKQGWIVKVRMRYLDFTGKFMLHCHILDHEDRGMMQLMEIVP